MSAWQILDGDCRDRLRELAPASVQTVVTSPPYFGLRDYGSTGQIGLEPTPDEFVAALVAVFREVRRVLRDDGTVWLNLGDSYASNGARGDTRSGFNARYFGEDAVSGWADKQGETNKHLPPNVVPQGCKPKDLLGIPWMVAFALRADGWYLRSDIIWAKPNPMPESVTDRPTKAHEYLFLLSKGPRYFYDADAVREEQAGEFLSSGARNPRYGRPGGMLPSEAAGALSPKMADRDEQGSATMARFKGQPMDGGRNKRTVWTVATQPYAGAHFATFPPKLIEPCILAGSPPKCCGECGAPWRRVVETTASGQGIECPQDRESWEARWAPRGGVNEASVAASRLHGQYHDVRRQTTGWEPTCTHQDDTGRSVVLDPFAGAGTTGVVCGWHDRAHVGLELNPEYAAMARRRITLEGRPSYRREILPDPIPGQLDLFA